MRVSVVICTRNRADELANCLSSLEYQTATEFEVLVVQGPGEDHTDAVIERYAGRIRRLRCGHPNLSEARNIGIAAAAGEVVAFIDDDAVAHPKWLEQIMSAYTAEDIGGVGGLVFDHTGRTLQYRYSACWRSGDTTFDVAPPFDELNRPHANPFLYLQGTNCSFRTRCLAEIGGFDEQFAYYHDETDVCLRMIDKGYRLVPLDGAVVYHNFSESSIRTSARIVLDPYFFVRSQYIFALRHGRPFCSDGELLRRIHGHMARVVGAGSEARARGELSDDQLTRYLARVLEGRTSGLEADGRRPILRAFEDRGHAQFLRFPVKREPSSRITVCFLSREYPPVGYGGIGRFTHDLAVGFADEGHHVHVVTDSARGDATNFENGVWIHRLACAPPVSPHRLALAHHYELAARNYREIDRIFRDTPIDVVSAPLWNCEGVAAAFDDRFPTVLSLMTGHKTVKEIHPSTHNTAESMRLLELEQACYRAHKYLHAISADVLDRAAADFGRDATAVTAKVVHLGVGDNTRGRRACLNRQPSRVLFVGRLERRKGVDLLLDAAAALIDERLDVEFHLVGSDTIHNELGHQNYRTWFETTFHDRPEILSRVAFIGPVSEADLHQHYADASIFCLPSRYESLGLVLMEAMSFGLPVVAANTGGMREIVTHDTDGLLFEPESEQALAAALRRLATDSEARVRMGKAARQKFESRFSTAVAVPRTLEYYQAIVRSFPRRAGRAAVSRRFAELIGHCSETDERLARQIADDLLTPSTARTTQTHKVKRSNLERFGRFLSELPRSLGRSKRRIKRILSILSIMERQDADVRAAINSLSDAQSSTDSKVDALLREHRVLQKQIGESHRLLANLKKADGDPLNRDVEQIAMEIRGQKPQ